MVHFRGITVGLRFKTHCYIVFCDTATGYMEQTRSRPVAYTSSYFHCLQDKSISYNYFCETLLSLPETVCADSAMFHTIGCKKKKKKKPIQ